MYEGKLRQVTSSQKKQYGMLMTAAFFADPAARYIWSRADQFMNVFPEYSLLYQGLAINDGTAWATEEFAAAISWLKPRSLPDGEKILELALSTCDPNRREEVELFFAEVESYFPKQDCWYLPIIGVDPAYMAKGLGSFLMRETLKIIDRSGEGAYLESSNPRNVDFYKNFGFKPLASIRLGGKEVSTPMYRKPIA